MLISTVFAGMVAVSAASGSIYLPSFLSFSIPLVTPLALTHLYSDSDSLALTGLLLIVFLVVNLFLAARGNRQFRELIELALREPGAAQSARGGEDDRPAGGHRQEPFPRRGES